MPIFEYACLECGQQFEHLQRNSDSHVACPSCGRENLERQVSLCGVSSEASRAANLSAAHKRAAGKRYDRARAEHAQNHDHFGDSVKG